MITLANGASYDVHYCGIAPVFGWLHIEFIRTSRAVVEQAVANAEALATIVYENEEFRKTYVGYTQVQRIEDTDIGVKAVLMIPEEEAENVADE